MPSAWHDSPFRNSGETPNHSNQNQSSLAPAPPHYHQYPKTAPTARKIYNHPLVENSNNNNSSDHSDYGELRAIVQRIERNHNESKSITNKIPAKKLVFDYVPASVMMKK